MVEMDSYDSITIGLKLTPGIPLDEFMKEIKGILNRAEDYIVPPKQQIGGLQFKIGLPLESLGIKNNVEVKLNLQTQSINIIGNILNDVKSIFEEFLELLRGNYEDLEDIILFYEIVANVGFKSQNPMGELKNAIKINLDSLNEFDSDFSIIGIRMGSFRKNLDSNDHISLIIEPKKGSHSSKYLAKISYQSIEKDRMLNFPLEEELNKIISSLNEE